MRGLASLPRPRFERPSSHGGLIASEHRFAETISARWAKGSGGPAGDELQNPITHSLRPDGFDASEGGTGRRVPIIARSICRDSFSGDSGGRPDAAAAGRKRVLRDLQDDAVYLRAKYPELSEQEALQLAADGPRYKALRASRAVPAVRWIMDPIRTNHETNMKHAQ